MAGTIEKLKSGNYRLRYSFRGNRYSETIKMDNVKTLNDKRLQLALANFIERVEKGNYANTNYTFTEFAQIWLDNVARKNCTESVVNKYILYLNNRILPYLGKYKLDEINTFILNDFYDELKKSKTMYKMRENKPISKGTVERIKDIVSSIFTSAYDMEFIQKNPHTKVKIKYDISNQKDESIHYYDKDTYEKVLELLNNETIEHKTIIELALKTGFRRSEIFGLTWNDVDFENKTISVNRTRHHRKGGGMYVGNVKTQKSCRTISIPDSLIATLQNYKLIYAGNEFLFENLSIDGITNWFKKWQIKNEITPIRFHDLRHTHATLLLSQGVDLKTIQNRLGHTNITMTMDTYTHVLEELDKTASTKLDQLL